MKRKLAVIGGSYLQLPLVLKAQEMGLEVHCFAWKDGAVCENVADFYYPISIIEKDIILEKCREIGIDGVTSIASDLAVLTVNYIANHLGLTGNNDAFSYIQTNKYAMRRCFDEAGVPSPRYHRLSSTQSIPSFGDWRWPLIVKPTDRSGSRAVQKVETQEQLRAAVQEAIGVSFAGEAIVEEFITGVEVSVESISWKGEHYVLQITDKVTTEDRFVEIAHHQPSLLPGIIKERIRDIVREALTAMHVENGASHAELKITGEGDICIMEIGARMGGGFIGSHLVPLSTGYDYTRGVIEIALGYFRKPEFTLSKCSGIFFLTKETSYLADIIEKAKDYPDIVVAARTENEIRPAISESDRTGYVIYQSNHRINSLL